MFFPICRNLPQFQRLFMGVKGMFLVLETLCPTKTDIQRATTEKRRENAVAASQELLCGTLVSSELSGKISNSIQSQLIEKWPDPCHGFPSTGYQNATDILLVLPIVNWASCKKIHAPRNQSTTPQQKFKGWFLQTKRKWCLITVLP